MSTAPGTHPSCLNCGTTVTGNFCTNCGQRRDVHVKSVGEIFHDFTHSLTHLDARAWQTLRLLVLRPGELTREFFRGRLESYLPPFRLYLVMSVIFFGVSALMPDDNFVSSTVPETIAAGEQAPSNACDIDVDLPYLAGAGPPLSAACKRVAADGGKRFRQIIAETVPKLMFVFLPLIAAFPLLLYWRPRRLYAEHLVFFLHGHAVLFLALTVGELFKGLGVLLPAVAGLLGFATAVLVMSLLWYFFRAMRVVYGQGRALTALKFAVTLVAYSVLLAVTAMGGIIYAALRV